MSAWTSKFPLSNASLVVPCCSFFASVHSGERDRASAEDARGGAGDAGPGAAEPAPARDVAADGEQGAREAAARVPQDGRGEEELLREHGKTHVRLQDLRQGEIISPFNLCTMAMYILM